MDFKDLNLKELDKNLTEPERAEWQSIYASYRSGSVMYGNVVGVDMHEFKLRPTSEEEEFEKRTMRCLIVIPYLVKIIIPEHEVFIGDRSTEYHMMHSMCGARVSYVITHIDREEGFAIASRKLSLEKIKRASIRRMGKAGDVVDVDVLAVGQNLCTVTYNGYDITVPQRDVSYGRIEDLRAEMLPGDVRKALITEYNVDEKVLKLTLKGATAHPFDGIEIRHPLGSTRLAKLVGKYAGGVFCRLYDGVTTILCSYLSMQYDGDFHEGDIVEVIINKYNYDTKQVYGKILRKIGN